MNADRELLDLAAKAAGLDAVWDDDLQEHAIYDDDGMLIDGWDPITYDGDALRLAVQLHIVVWDWGQYQKAMVEVRHGNARGEYWEDVGDDPYAATRRAIVRAAAEIGRSMP